ncbi:MAG: 50S ribosomal protein L11 methyltransferase [Chloroflexi bacterium]|nr:50S ribosomal protein L11 methyltransferase [Chloroflexota bacterium]MCH8224533.1 50S ribosomal protein L11 methyltransferase [Chloroflexota bacterium]
MVWQEISITVPFEYVEPVSYLFNRYGRGLSMELGEDERILMRTYLQDTSRQRFARIEVGIRLVNLLEPLGDLIITDLSEDEDWRENWKAHFNLLRVGQHLVIKPSWIDYEASPDDLLIELDPGMAFGTGYHPTTYGCLEALEQEVRPGMTVLDLGTGSGILAMTALKLGASRVVALDVDPEAIRAARQNFRRTRVQRQVSLAQGTVPHPLAGNGLFDLAVANISDRAIRERAQFIIPALAPQGLFIASGLLAKEREGVDDTLAELGFACVDTKPHEDWITIIYRSSSA